GSRCARPSIRTRCDSHGGNCTQHASMDAHTGSSPDGLALDASMDASDPLVRGTAGPEPTPGSTPAGVIRPPPTRAAPAGDLGRRCLTIGSFSRELSRMPQPLVIVESPAKAR